MVYAFNLDYNSSMLSKRTTMLIQRCYTDGKQNHVVWMSESCCVLVHGFLFDCNRYSGVTKGKLKNVETRLADVQRTIRSILPPDAILCGQSLNGDLTTLRV